MKTVTNLWPVSGSHVLSLCKSNPLWSKGPSGPLLQEGKPVFLLAWVVKNEIFKFHKEKKKKLALFFTELLFALFKEFI